jgi:rubrerythrin
MELKNFGSVLSFAAELEASDGAFYQCAAQNPVCQSYKNLFEGLAKEHQQNEQRILRVRRENVTEMILEPIKDFTRTPFALQCTDAERMDLKEVVETARKLETRSEHYYREAAEKIKPLPEVAGELKRIGKKHAVHGEKLRDLSTN